MSFEILDTTSAQTDLSWNQSTQMDGREYLLDFDWSAREGLFYLNVSDQDGNPLASGITLVLNAGATPNASGISGLLRRFQNPALPPGTLYLVDTSGADLDIQAPTDLGTDDNGARVWLCYDAVTNLDQAAD